MTDFTHRGSLGALTDPAAFTGPLDVAGQDPDTLRAELAMLHRIRIVEERIGDLQEQGEIRTPIHLGIGQEAVATGISRHLRATDRVFGGHRSHSHYLALGGDVEALVAEILCRATGAAAGRGGSMHLIGQEVGFSGSVPLVGATVPLGVGAALAAKFDARAGADGAPDLDVGVSYFGDGACEEGVVHESLNLAVVLNAPTLFVVENNLYSSHLDIALRQPDDRTARLAEAHRMRTEVVDGNDVVAVAAAAGRLIAAARAGEGPGFLEAVTYRWRGHVGPDANIDVGVRRSAEEVAAWKGRDPVARLVAGLEAAGHLAPGEAGQIEGTERARVEAALAAARAAPRPDPATVTDHVYADPA
ncbi:MAG: thiamine pyrophosphate-dependent dehydrogenase E1 component subunit alpha [Shimia sp.]